MGKDFLPPNIMNIKKKNMMKIFQKIVFITALILSGLFLIYTLVYSTNWALWNGWFDDFFDAAQVANKALFKLAIYSVVLSGFGLMFGNHNGRKFYFYNNIVSVLFALLFIFAGVKTILFNLELKPMFLDIVQNNQAFLQILLAANYGSTSPRIFDVGLIMSGFMFIEAILVLYVTYYKNKSNIKSLFAKSNKEDQAEVLS